MYIYSSLDLIPKSKVVEFAGLCLIFFYFIYQIIILTCQKRKKKNWTSCALGGIIYGAWAHYLTPTMAITSLYYCHTAWLIESLWVFIVSFLSCLVHSHFNNGDLHDILVEGCICKTSVAIHLYTHSVDQFLNLFSFVLLELCLSIYTTTAFLHFQSKKKKKSQNI